jgi:hypothetical protein
MVVTTIGDGRSLALEKKTLEIVTGLDSSKGLFYNI